MKTNSETVLFTDECRATLDGPHGRSGGWLVDMYENAPSHVARNASASLAAIEEKLIVWPPIFP